MNEQDKIQLTLWEESELEELQKERIDKPTLCRIEDPDCEACQ